MEKQLKELLEELKKDLPNPYHERASFELLKKIQYHIYKLESIIDVSKISDQGNSRIDIFNISELERLGSLINKLDLNKVIFTSSDNNELNIDKKLINTWSKSGNTNIEFIDILRCMYINYFTA